MFIYKKGKAVDSVLMAHRIEPTSQAGSYVWRTEYFSPTIPVVKDHTLREQDVSRGLFVIDEGDGLELKACLLGPRLLSTFEVGGSFLTANYELRGTELIFEVTSARKDSLTGGGVTNYSLGTLQRAVMKKEQH